MDAISPSQIRGARAMLGWSLVELARAAQVSVAAVASAEKCARASADAARAIRSALAEAGIEFTSDRGTLGVRLKASEPSLFGGLV